MENLSHKIVGIYRLHSSAFGIDKYWYNSVQFKLPSSFLQAWDWQCDNCGGVTDFLKYIFMFSVNVHKKRASKYIPRDVSQKTGHPPLAYNFAKCCPIFKILSPPDSVVNT